MNHMSDTDITFSVNQMTKNSRVGASVLPPTHPGMLNTPHPMMGGGMIGPGMGIPPPPLGLGFGIGGGFGNNMWWHDDDDCRRDRRRRRSRDTSITVSFLPNQVVAAGATTQIILGSFSSSNGNRGFDIDNGSLVIRRDDTYIITLNATVTRAASANPTGTFFFSLSGGVSNGTNIAGGSIEQNETLVFSGISQTRVNGRVTISVFATNNTLDAVTVTSGTLGATST